MEANINKIERSSDYAGVVFVVSARRMDRREKPKRDYFIQKWMETDKSEAAEVALAESTQKYEAALAGWKEHEARATAHNNTLDALRLGEVTIEQVAFVPKEVRE